MELTAEPVSLLPQIESTAFLASIVESSDAAIVGEQLDGTILSWNKGAEEMYGYRAEEVIGKPITIIIPPERHGEIPTAIERLKRGEQIPRLHTVRTTKDFRLIDVSLTLSLTRNRAGKVTGVAAVAHDITARKRAEQEARENTDKLLQAKKEAEAANQIKNEFLANMSHEFRTPINGILGMTELVLESNLCPEQRENLELVKLSGESLLAIVNDVLDFSRIEAGRLDLEYITFDLRESLHETMKMLGFRAQQKGLELIYDVQPDVPESFRGDPGSIRHVLLNLVSNAIKFTKLGEIFITVNGEGIEAGAVTLHFAVKDTGIGMCLKDQKKIFEAFCQANGSLTRDYGGAGLGLTIAAKLVQMMRGKIWVESQLDRGSTFHFTVPLEVQDALPAPANPVRLEQLRGLPALIVDDSSVNRRLLQGMLNRWGMQTAAAADARTALEALQVARDIGRPFRIMLMDGQIHEMDGFTLAEQIQQRPGDSDITVIMLTSVGQLGDAARCRRVGISAYLVKPIRPNELLDAICYAVANAQTGSGEQNAPLLTRHTLREFKHKSHPAAKRDAAGKESI